jgi:hypothetical protein
MAVDLFLKLLGIYRQPTSRTSSNRMALNCSTRCQYKFILKIRQWIPSTKNYLTLLYKRSEALFNKKFEALPTGTAQPDFLLQIFSRMGSSQALYLVLKDFIEFGFKFKEIFAIFD